MLAVFLKAMKMPTHDSLVILTFYRAEGDSDRRWREERRERERERGGRGRGADRRG